MTGRRHCCGGQNDKRAKTGIYFENIPGESYGDGRHSLQNAGMFNGDYEDDDLEFSPFDIEDETH